jgi:hypothetical protein
MSPPSVYDVTIPSSQRTRRMMMSVESTMIPFGPSTILERGLSTVCSLVHTCSRGRVLRPGSLRGFAIPVRHLPSIGPVSRLRGVMCNRVTAGE